MSNTISSTYRYVLRRNRAIGKLDEYFLWSLIHDLQPVLLRPFKVQLHSGLSVVEKRILRYNFGFEKASDLNEELFNKLSGNSFEVLSDYSESIEKKDFLHAAKKGSTAGGFLALRNRILFPSHPGDRWLSSQLSQETLGHIVASTKPLEESTLQQKHARDIIWKLLDNLSQTDDLYFLCPTHVWALSQRINLFDYTEADPEKRYIYNWHLLHAAFPDSVCTPIGRPRHRIPIGEVDPTLIAFESLQPVTPLGQHMQSNLSSQDKSILQSHIQTPRAQQKIALHLVCLTLQELLASNAFIESGIIDQYSRFDDYTEDLEQHIAELTTLSKSFPGIKERITEHINRLIFELLFPDVLPSAPQKFEGWIYYVTLNICKNIKKRVQRKLDKSTLLTDDNGLPPENQLVGDLNKAMQSLKDAHTLIQDHTQNNVEYDVLRLAFIEGMKDEDVAVLMAKKYTGNGPWHRKKVHKIKMLAIEHLSSSLYINREDYHYLLKDSTVENDLAVLSIDTIDRTLYATHPEQKTIYILSGITHEGKRVFVGTHASRTIEGTLVWIMEQGMDRIQLVIADHIEGVPTMLGAYLPSARWQYSHLHIKHDLKHQPFKKHVVSVLDASTPDESEEGLDLLLQFAPQITPILSFDYLKHALTVHYLQSLSPLQKKELRWFNSTHLFKEVQEIGINPRDSHDAVMKKAINFMVGKKTTLRRSPRLTMPDWNSFRSDSIS